MRLDRLYCFHLFSIRGGYSNGLPLESFSSGEVRWLGVRVMVVKSSHAYCCSACKHHKTFLPQRAPEQVQ